MKLALVSLALAAAILVNCGSPPEYHPTNAVASSQAQQDKKQAMTKNPKMEVEPEANTKEDSSPDGESAKPPVPVTSVVVKAPIRALVSATEIADAKTEYAADCANCHQALATSAKKGATLARMNAAGVIS